MVCAGAAVAGGVPPAGSETKPNEPAPRPVDELFTGTLAGLPALVHPGEADADGRCNGRGRGGRPGRLVGRRAAIAGGE